MSIPCAVYRIYSDRGRLLYVGQSEELRSAILDLIEMSGPPLTVRQVHYVGISHRLWEKDTDSRQRIGRHLSGGAS